jgi:hypothetical protein
MDVIQMVRGECNPFYNTVGASGAGFASRDLIQDFDAGTMVTVSTGSI